MAFLQIYYGYGAKYHVRSDYEVLVHHRLLQRCWCIAGLMLTTDHSMLTTDHSMVLSYRCILGCVEIGTCSTQNRVPVYHGICVPYGVARALKLVKVPG